jgi:HEAT repeat protein
MAPSKDILRRLAGGDRRSIGQSNQIAALVLKRSALFGHLVRGLRAPDPVVRMRAADAAEKVSLERPDLLVSFKTELLRLLETATEQELRWHLAQIVPRLPLTRRDRLRAFSAFQSYLQDRSSIVRTCAMQALADLASSDTGLLRQVVKLLRKHTENGTAAMKARGRKLLHQLEGR